MAIKSRQLHGPKGFRQARREGASMVEKRPYFPSLKVDLQDEATVVTAAKVILSCVEEIKADEINTNSDVGNDTTSAKVSMMSGGLTNALFRVDISDEQKPSSSSTTSVLVRIFGAEGLIDRDTETANLARLCNSKGSVVHSQLDYLGRFGNGRIETLIPHMRAATICDFRESEELVLEVIRQMARLHYGFDIPEFLIDRDSTSSCGGDGEGESNCRQLQPVLWDVFISWNDELITKITQVCSRDLRLVDIFCSALFGDTLQFGHIVVDDGDGLNKSALTEIISQIAHMLNRETQWIQDHVIEHHPDATIAFCHNDINAANILINDGLDSDGSGYHRDSVALIDFEYGALNSTQYDIANFICEHCGGNDNGSPNYELIPSPELQRKLVQEYIQERDRVLNNAAKHHVDEQKEVMKLLSQVQTFQMVSHLYWGTWGILQGVTELLERRYEIENVKSRLYSESDADEWDNLRYGMNRLKRYRKHKQSKLEIGQKQMSY